MQTLRNRWGSLNLPMLNDFSLNYIFIKLGTDPRNDVCFYIEMKIREKARKIIVSQMLEETADENKSAAWTPLGIQ